MRILRAQVELEDFDAVKVWQFSMKSKTAQGVSVHGGAQPAGGGWGGALVVEGFVR